jgi:hypothetical protein
MYESFLWCWAGAVSWISQSVLPSPTTRGKTQPAPHRQITNPTIECKPYDPATELNKKPRTKTQTPSTSQVCRCTPAIPALRRLRKENPKFEAKQNKTKTQALNTVTESNLKLNHRTKSQNPTTEDGHKILAQARYLWLMPVILAIGKPKLGGSRFKASLGR